MAESTRAKALEKMGAFGVKVGFPDTWIDYSSLEVRLGDHLGNVQRARAFEHKRAMAFADAPTDRTRWQMLPQQINAYYHPNLNEIVFPAAILQPPFFDATADDAVNFGSFGAVVGHEMTHGAWTRPCPCTRLHGDTPQSRTCPDRVTDGRVAIPSHPTGPDVNWRGRNPIPEFNSRILHWCIFSTLILGVPAGRGRF